MDIDFWDLLLRGLRYQELELLEMHIKRLKESMHPEIITRKTIIRKQED